MPKLMMDFAAVCFVAEEAIASTAMSCWLLQFVFGLGQHHHEFDDSGPSKHGVSDVDRTLQQRRQRHACARLTGDILVRQHVVHELLHLVLILFSFRI